VCSQPKHQLLGLFYCVCNFWLKLLFQFIWLTEILLLLAGVWALCTPTFRRLNFLFVFSFLQSAPNSIQNLFHFCSFHKWFPLYLVTNLIGFGWRQALTNLAGVLVSSFRASNFRLFVWTVSLSNALWLVSNQFEADCANSRHVIIYKHNDMFAMRLPLHSFYIALSAVSFSFVLTWRMWPIS